MIAAQLAHGDKIANVGTVIGQPVRVGKRVVACVETQLGLRTGVMYDQGEEVALGTTKTATGEAAVTEEADE